MLFRSTALPSGHAVRIGVANYRGVLTFEAAPQGLIVRVAALFPFHAALLFPWEAISLRPAAGVWSAGALQVAGGSTFHLNGEALAAIERARPR